MIDRIIQAVIGQLFMDLLCDGLACDQGLDLSFCQAVIDFFNEMPDHTVAAGIGPIILRLHSWIVQKIVTVVDHIPRAIYVHISETIAVIPVLRSLISIFQAIIAQHFSDLAVCKAKILIETHSRDGEDLGVVEASEDTLLCHPQAASQHREIKAFIRFQGLIEQVPDQGDHPSVIAFFICFCQRYIILIDQDDHFLPMMFMEQDRKLTQAAAQGLIIHIILKESGKTFFIL